MRDVICARLPDGHVVLSVVVGAHELEGQPVHAYRLDDGSGRTVGVFTELGELARHLTQDAIGSAFMRERYGGP